MVTYSANTPLLKTHSVPGTTPGTGDILGIKDINMSSCSWNNGLVGEAGLSQGITPLDLKGHLGFFLQGKGTWCYKSYKAALGK